MLVGSGLWERILSSVHLGSLIDLLGRQGIVSSGGSLSNFTRPSSRPGQGRVIISGRLVTELEDTEESTDSLSDFIHGAIWLAVDLFQSLDHASNLADAVVQFLLLLLESVDKLLDVVQGALALVAVIGLFQNGSIFFG